MLFLCHLHQDFLIILVVIFQFNLKTGSTILHVCLDDLVLLRDGEGRHVRLLKGFAQLRVLLVQQLELLVDRLLLLV